MNFEPGVTVMSSTLIIDILMVFDRQKYIWTMDIIALGKRSLSPKQFAYVNQLRTKLNYKITNEIENLRTCEPFPRNLKPSSAIQVLYNPD